MKKATRAYKVGLTDGQNGEHTDRYAEGSTRWVDYEKGFDVGSKTPDSDCTRLTEGEAS